MTRITKIAALSAATVAAVISTAAGANAATYNPDGTGFIGKGEVQSAFGFNNSTLQKAVDGKGFSFRTEQSVSQSLSQRLSQSSEQEGTLAGTQAGTQTVSQHSEQAVTQVLTCTKTTGQVEQRYREGYRTADRTAERSATRTAEREAERVGTRTGVRYGTQSGTQSGSLTAVIDAEARKTGQWTGWKVTKTTKAPVAPSGVDMFDALPTSLSGNYAFDGWAMGAVTGTGDWDNFGDYEFGAYAWSTPVFTGDFIATDGPNSDPNGVCVVGKNNVTDVALNIVPGGITDDPVAYYEPVPGAFTATSTEVTEGAVTDGTVGVVAGSEIKRGSWTASGPIVTFAKNLNEAPMPQAQVEKRLG